MTAAPATGKADEQRLLLLLPTQRDCTVTGDVLGRDGIAVHACPSPADLERVRQGLQHAARRLR